MKLRILLRGLVSVHVVRHLRRLCQLALAVRRAEKPSGLSPTSSLLSRSIPPTSHRCDRTSRVPGHGSRVQQEPGNHREHKMERWVLDRVYYDVVLSCTRLNQTRRHRTYRWNVMEDRHQAGKGSISMQMNISVRPKEMCSLSMLW